MACDYGDDMVFKTRNINTGCMGYPDKSFSEYLVHDSGPNEYKIFASTKIIKITCIVIKTKGVCNISAKSALGNINSFIYIIHLQDLTH